MVAMGNVTASPHQCITTSVSHLPCPLPPNQSVICLAPTTKPVSHLTCPLPPWHHIIAAPRHYITAALHHCITTSPHQSVICLAPCHQTSQSFALPPATKPVSHLTCPLPLHHCITTSPCHHSTTSLWHHITASVSHLPCPLPPN